MKEGKSSEVFDEILAHTDFDYGDEGDLQLAKEAKLHQRGNHACVGAFAARKVVEQLSCEMLSSAISLAIARHHSSRLSRGICEFEVSDKNYEAIQSLLGEYGFSDIVLPKVEYGSELRGYCYDDYEDEHILYLFFVRILRICDQKATEDYKKYYRE